MMSIIQNARRLASDAHESIKQKRKYTNEPYIHHPERVAQLVASVEHDHNMIAAAWLHDVIEDVYPINNEYDIHLIATETNYHVARLVIELTDVSKPEDGNRAARKAIDRQKLAAASDKAKTIKLADLIDNTRDICTHDKKFAKIYLEEKALLLPLLTRGNNVLYQFCKYMLDASKNSLMVNDKVNYEQVD